jgi:hypothetical protein
MMTDIAIDTLVGPISIVGDAFDFAYKSNLRNLRIYEQSLYAGHADTARHWGFFITIVHGVAGRIRARRPCFSRAGREAILSGSRSRRARLRKVLGMEAPKPRIAQLVSASSEFHNSW